ncbi:hypothetical protein ACFLWU_02770 [Chloroflexota bacterium]
MKTTWKPLVAGILNIIVGVLNVMILFAVIMLLVAAGGAVLAFGRIADLIPIWMSGILQGVMIIVAFAIGIFGALPLIGGVNAVQRKNWALALAGSIVAILYIFPFGIVSTILLVSSREEFK